MCITNVFLSLSVAYLTRKAHVFDCRVVLQTDNDNIISPVYLHKESFQTLSCYRWFL